MNGIKNWVEILPIVELAINSLPRYSPFFLNYGYHPAVLDDLLCGNWKLAMKRLAICKRKKDIGYAAYENMKKAISLLAKYYSE